MQRKKSHYINCDIYHLEVNLNSKTALKLAAGDTRWVEEKKQTQNLFCLLSYQHHLVVSLLPGSD